MFFADKFQDNRYLYIKRGDVVDELKYLSRSSTIIHDGPLAYFSQFYKLYQNHPSFVISFTDRKGHFKWGKCDAHNIHTLYLTLLGKVIGRFKLAFTLICYLIKFYPNKILSAADGLPLWICFLYSKLTNAVLIHTRHNSLEPSSESTISLAFHKFSNFIDKAVITKLPYVMVHGKYIEDQALKFIKNSSKIITFRPSYRNFYSQSMANKNAIGDYTENGKYVIISFVGRINANKGVFDLLDAFLELIKEDNSLRLVIAGDGPDSKSLKKAISEADRNENIIYLGQIENSHLGSLITQSKFVVTPTRSTFPEAFCKAAVEPLILGVPVIVPNFGPFPYFIQNEENGLIFEPDSVKSLECTIRKGLTDNRLYDTLRSGAAKSGKKLIDPPLSFTNALQKAFK